MHGGQGVGIVAATGSHMVSEEIFGALAEGVGNDIMGGVVHREVECDDAVAPEMHGRQGVDDA